MKRLRKKRLPLKDTSSRGSTLLEKCRNDIEKYLDVSHLTPSLCSSGLIDLYSPVADEDAKRKERVDCLMKCLSEGGDVALRQFVQALNRDANEHMGHRYIASLLEGRANGPEDRELAAASKLIEKNIYDHMPDIIHSLNGRELMCFLYQHQLLTSDECEELRDHHTTTEVRNRRILRILSTKGPTAHSIFAECLERSSSLVPEHKGLCTLISRHCAVKTPCAIPKQPPHIHPEGMLVSKTYFEIIKRIRLLNLEGMFDEADRIVQQSKVHKSIELDVALLLESCTASITKKDEESAIAKVKRAKEMCIQINNNSRTVLEGRCMWALGKLYRYLKQNDKALDYIMQAQSTLFNVAPGEDTALTNYCSSVVQLDKIAHGENASEYFVAQKNLEMAICHAQLGDYGLDLSHPRLRLAQLYLGSSPHKAGKAANPDSVCSAQGLLSQLEATPMAIRTKCIYYYTMSDLRWNENNSAEALKFANIARDIAIENGFETEKSSVEQRLNNLLVVNVG